ncbi:MAG TPA: hypothetical protein VIK80_12920, partial [Flavihumibacter sp.]
MVDSSRRGVDTTRPKGVDTLRFPLEDRRTIPGIGRNPFDLNDPKNLNKTVEYDPLTRQYYIVEKIGDQYFRTPTYMSFEEYLRYRAAQQERDYFRQRADVLTGLNRKNIRPKLSVSES